MIGCARGNLAIDGLVVYGDDDALAPEEVGRLLNQTGIEYGCGVERYLVRSGFKHLADVHDRPHSSTNRQRDEDLLGDLLDDVDHDIAVLSARGNVEKDKLVRSLSIIEGGQLSRVAGVTDIDERNTLDDTTAVDIQAWDDAFGQHG